MNTRLIASLILMLIIGLAIGYFIGVYDIMMTLRSDAGMLKLCEALI